MKQRLRQGKLDLSNRRDKLPEREHGDWRKALANPAEAEHLKPKPVKIPLKELVTMRAECYQIGSTAEWMADARENAGWEKIHGARRVWRLILSYLVMLPISVALLFALLVQLYEHSPAVDSLENISFWLSEPVWFSLMGLLVFAVLIAASVATPVLVWVYVLGHELTHAITALLCGGKVHDISVDAEGGYVETDADNVFIALSPYFLPLWMLCWLGGLWAVHWCYPFEPYLPWFYAGFGFWSAFHVYWTIWILPREQPDMLSNGIVFSTLLILIMNVLVCIGVLSVFDVISLQEYGLTLWRCTLELYETGCYVSQLVWQHLQPLLQ